MLGRGREQAVVAGRLDVGAPVLVIGPAGIGKSTLVRSVLRDRPHVVGGAVASLRWRPYLPLMRAINEHLAGEVDRVVTTVARTLAGRVLFVDDLQWADAGTISVLDVLSTRVAVVVTARPEGSGALWARRWERVELGGLPPRVARQLVQRVHPGLSAAAQQHLVEIADGNPLLLHHLVGRTEPTPTLRAALVHRLAQVSAAARDLVIDLAVHGRPIPFDESAVAPGDLPHELVTVTNGYVALCHDLLVDAALVDLDGELRVAAHLRVARRLRPTDAAEHFLAAGALVEAEAAARAALADEDDPVICAHLRGVLADSTGDDADRVRAAATLGRVGRWSDAQRHAGCVSARDPCVAAAAALERSRALWFAGDPVRAREAIESGLELVGGTDHPLRATLSVERAHQLVRTHEAGRLSAPIAEAALAVAERLGVDVLRAQLVYAAALARDGRHGWDERYRQVIADAREAGESETECWATYLLASRCGFDGRHGEAIEVLLAGVPRAGLLGEVTWADHMAGALVTERFTVGGDPASVAASARRFVAEHPSFVNRTQVVLALALSLGDVGRFAEAFAALDEALDTRPSAINRSILVTARAELAWMAGRLDEAIEVADEALAFGTGWFGITAGAAAASALACFELDRPVELTVLPPAVALFAPFSAEVDGLRAWSRGDAGLAIDLLDQAATRWRATGPHRYGPRADWVAGRIAQRIGHPSATRRLAAADRAARAAGLGPIARRTADALRDVEPDLALSARESEVLRLVRGGLTSPQVGVQLGIAPSTVETHVRSAMRKLGARTRRHAVLLVGDEAGA